MAGALWGLLALAGIAIVVIANKLRAKRTNGCGCAGHFFVAASELSALEWVLNRGGITLFVVGIIGGVVT